MPQRIADATTELVLEIFRLNGELIAMGDALVGDIGLTSARWQVMGAIKGETAYAAAMTRWEPKAVALGGGSTLKDVETSLATLRRVRQRISKDHG
jgi:hypothetical protein